MGSSLCPAPSSLTFMPRRIPHISGAAGSSNAQSSGARPTRPKPTNGLGVACNAVRGRLLYKQDSEPLEQFIRRKGGINACAARFSRWLGRGGARR
jgi:hypothetical protein